MLGVHDAAPVVHEPFRQWAIEDTFVAGRPGWDRVGAQMVRDVAPFAADAGEALWRVSLPPTAGAAVVRELGEGPRYFYDWGGGLIWLSLPAEGDGGAERLRGAVAAVGGHATLVRAPMALRAAVDVFQPQDAALAALTRRVKESFDPLRRFNPGRMYRDV